MVVWIIGLSASGKSTLGAEVARLARERADNVVLLDGDAVRAALGADLGHGLEDRRRNARRLCGLCKLLSDQGQRVVCCVLSLFEESRRWNRENIEGYHEVFVDAPMDVLAARDPKGLYAKARAGEIDLPGVNLDFPRPERPDRIIVNDGDLEKFLAHAPAIADVLLEGP